MAQIKETQTVVPVLPSKAGNGVKQDSTRAVTRRPKKQQKRQRRGPEDGHQLDEYA